MAYGCIYFLKQECDGCGRCQEPMHSYSKISGGDEDIPFSDIDEYDEEEW